MSWSGFFFMVAVVCLVICIWVFVYLPETKGKHLEEMAQYFAELTGDRSVMEAEEVIHRRSSVIDNDAQSNGAQQHTGTMA